MVMFGYSFREVVANLALRPASFSRHGLHVADGDGSFGTEVQGKSSYHCALTASGGSAIL